MKKLKLLFATFALLLGVSNAMAQKDVTSQYITNATLSSFTTNPLVITGWTNVNFNTPARGNNTAGYAVEAYAGWGSLTMTEYSLTQTITLPAGHYTLVNYSFYRYGEAYNSDNTKSLAYLKAGENQVAVKTLGSITAAGYANSQAEGANCFDSKMYRNTLDFTIDADNTPIVIGVTGTHDLMRSWMILGMFELINNDIPATMDSPFDVTGYITNPGFEYRDMTGWTLDPTGSFGTQSNEQSWKVGGWFAEKWQSSGNLDNRSMSQTLTDLPAGYYKLTANLGGSGTYVSLNGKTANWTSDKDYTVGYVLAENEDLTITAGKNGGNTNWIHFDNFRLQFCGDVAAALTTLLSKVSDYESVLPASDYTWLYNQVQNYNQSYSDVEELLAAISAVQALYEKADMYVSFLTALTVAQAINQETKMNATVLSGLQSAISDAASIDIEETLEDITAAKNSLTTATNNATTSIANYAEAKTILDAANGYDAAGQASYAANETIAAIQDAYDDGSLVSVSNDQKTAAQAALLVACKAQVQPANNCDMTAFISNPNISGDVTGWTCYMNGNGGYVGGPLKPSGDAMEFWAAGTQTDQDHGKSFDYYQQISSLPTGAYTISAQMLNSTNGEEGANWNGGGKAGLYGKTTSNEVQELITTDSEIFSLYTTDEILVVDGELRIGVKNIAALTGRWFAATQFKLTYVRQLTDEEKAEIAKEDLSATITAASSARKTANEGTGVFQIPTAAGTTLASAITTAQSVYDNAGATLSDVTTAISTLNAAVATYEATTLNAPDADTHYNIIVATTGHAKFNKAVVESLGATSANNPTGYAFNASATPNVNLAQAVKFTQVSGNTYNISFETSEGVVYLTYGSLNGSAAGWATQQIQGTTDSSKKGEFKIAATATANVFNIYNTITNSTIACQTGGSLYTEAGNADFSIAEASQATVDMTIDAAVQYATRIFPFTPTTWPNGVVAYSCEETEGNVLSLVEVNEPVANVPYILYAENGSTGSVSGWGTAPSTDAKKVGLLTGVYANTSAPVNSYVLQNNNSKVGFYKVAAEKQPTVGAYRCYLTDGENQGRAAFFFRGDITGVDNVEAAAEATLKDGKYLENGKIVIVKNGVKYNAAGAQVK